MYTNADRLVDITIFAAAFVVFALMFAVAYYHDRAEHYRHLARDYRLRLRKATR